MSFNFSDNNIAQCVSNEIKRKYHLENFQSMPTDRLIENLYRLVYDIIIYDDNDMNMNKVYVVTSYPKDSASIGERRAGFINSIWSDNEKANKEGLRLISMDQEQLFTYEAEE